jgi:hypothetical protein
MKYEKEIIAEIETAYELKGQSSACGVADKYKLPYEYCKGCETESPVIPGKHDCLICGTTTETKKQEVSKHTEGDFKISYILGADQETQIISIENNQGDTVAEFGNEGDIQAEHYAQLFCTAVNNHKALIDAVKMELWAIKNGEAEAQKQGRPRMITRIEILEELLKRCEE